MKRRAREVECKSGRKSEEAQTRAAQEHVK